VLEINVGNSGFTDILAAGGSFVTGGYNCTLYSGSGNPLGGRQAWGGNSGGWITTTVNLPAGAAGQTIQFRWGCGTDELNEYPVTGWFVDTISLKDASYSCCGDSADLSIIQSATPAQFGVGQNGTYNITVTNAGPDLAADVVVTDTLPGQVDFVSASPGCVFSNGVVVCPIGTILTGGSSTVSVNVTALKSGFVTNSVTVFSVTPSSNPGNATASSVTVVGSPPQITAGPSGIVAVAGADVTFQVAASGTGPLSYQWFFDLTNSLSGAASAQLTLTNVQAAQAGSYSVAVSDAAGSTNSAPAVLRVLVVPGLVPGAAALTSSGFSLSINSVVELNYSLEYKNQLDDPSWTLLPASTVIGTGGVITLQDPSAPGGQRFYEVICQ
jgi:uncharacterized repeat protein (TIGR01451 family)